MSSPAPDYLRYSQAVAEYPFSKSTLRRLVASGALPTSKIGRIVVIARADIEQLIASRRQEAA